MEIECEIDFSEAYYQEYDQELIDLFYFWNKDNKIIQFRKNHWVYTFVTLLYSGVPEELPNNKTISIKGNNISTKYGFFNEFAEKYIGEKAYIGNGLDSLIDSFRQSKIDKNYNKNIINISNYELLEEKMNFYNIGYLDEIISVLIDFGFNVNKMWTIILIKVNCETDYFESIQVKTIKTDWTENGSYKWKKWKQKPT